MRLIGHLDQEPAARTFADYLYVKGIITRLEHHKPEGWAVWVEDEDRLDEAGRLLSEFKSQPEAPRFREATAIAAAQREKREKETAAYQRRVRSGGQLFRPLTGYGFGPVTFVLIAISVVVFLISRFGADDQRIMGLFITDFTVDSTTISWMPNLPEVRHGQVWRLVTPIFIHMGILHILFNMLWLRDLGSMIEGRQGSGIFVALVLVIAVTSNLGEYYFGHHPNFGGMSGVVYGLLGYIWLRGKFDPASGLFLHQTTVVMMLVWFLICLVGLMPNVANWAHGVGLAVGMAWGYLSALRAPLNRA